MYTIKLCAQLQAEVGKLPGMGFLLNTLSFFEETESLIELEREEIFLSFSSMWLVNFRNELSHRVKS